MRELQPLVETMKEEDYDLGDAFAETVTNKPILKQYYFINDLTSPEGSELLQLHSKIVNATGNYFTEVGSYLKKAQSLLANNRNGNFQLFYESCGFTKQTVYKLIDRYELIVHNMDNKELLESLPLSLTYEAGAKNADPELKEKVLSGEITSRKQMEEWKEEKR